MAGSLKLALGTNLSNAVESMLQEDEIEGFGRFGIVCHGLDRPRLGDIDEKLETRYWRPFFVPKHAVSFDQLVAYIRSFQGLLSVLCGPVGFDNLQAMFLRTVGSGQHQTNVPDEVEIILRMTGYQSSFVEYHPGNVAIPLRNISDTWPTILSKWFSLYEKMSDVIELYLAVVLTPDLPAHHKFLFLAQAMEGYHRAQPGSKDKKFTPSEFKQRRKRVLEIGPESEKEWLEEAIKYPPGNTLKDRLLQVTEPLQNVLNIVIDDLDSFRATVKDARDYLTHPGNVESEKYNYDELWRQLRTLLELCVLRDIGVTSSVYETIAYKLRFTQ